VERESLTGPPFSGREKNTVGARKARAKAQREDRHRKRELTRTQRREHTRGDSHLYCSRTSKIDIQKEMEEGIQIRSKEVEVPEHF